MKAGSAKQPRSLTGLSRSPFAFPFLHAYRNAHVQRFFLSHRLSAYAPLCKATGSDCAWTRCTSDKADIDGGPANARSRQTGPLALHHRRPGSKAESRRASYLSLSCRKTLHGPVGNRERSEERRVGKEWVNKGKY